ncbi:MAG: ATP-binding protein [Bacteroidales bacterium]|jgi:serine/threonine-protein kinase RsbW|nr:ATP-binding protein [Bacteroidales bacterium]
MLPLKLTLNNSNRSILPALSFVEAFCREKGFSEKENNQLQLALEEVLSNVVRYAFDSKQGEAEFDLTVNESASFVEIKIREMGIPFTLDTAPKYDPQSVQTVDDAVHQKGLGTFLISKMVDKLSFSYLGAEGKEITLTKYLSNPKEVTEHEYCPVQSVRYAEQDITLHDFRDEEALNVARCLYTAYGYTYLKNSLYNPDYLREVAARDDYIITTAATLDGIIAGVAIGNEDSMMPGIMEMGSLVVSPAFRGMHLSDKIWSYLLKKIADKGKRGVFAECVTLHTASQRVSDQLGMYPCCVLLNYIPQNVNFKNFDRQKAERQTFIVHYKSLTNTVSEIYLPAAYADRIRRIYARIGVQMKELKPAEYSLPASCRQTTHRNDTFGLCFIAVRQIGDGLGDYLQKIKLVSEFNAVKTWNLYLRLGDPGLEYAIREGEAAGYLFTGIIPGIETGDLLVMQYVGNVDPYFEEIKLTDPAKDKWMIDAIKMDYDKRK